MAIEPALMQVISKDTDYSKNKVELKLFETSIKDIIRKIKDQSGDTLNAVVTGDYISNSLLTDIQTKQGANLSDFEDYLTEISDYTATDPRADISPYTSYDYNYSVMTSAYIAADQQILYRILAEIMNNEGYYHERRVSIRDQLWYIRNIIVDTGIFGQLEANMDNITDFTNDYTEENITLEAIYDVMEGGEEALQLKQYTITIGSGGGTSTKALASDEVLYSIDSWILNAGSYGSVTVDILHNGVTRTVDSISADTTIIGVTTSIKPSDVGLGASVKVTTTASLGGNLRFTVRKVAVYS